MRIVGITGGVDTHADVHVAAAVDAMGVASTGPRLYSTGSTVRISEM